MEEYKSPGYLASQDYNYYAEELKRKGEAVLSEIEKVSPEALDILRPYIEERNANDIGYIVQAQKAVTDYEREKAKNFAMEHGDTWFNRFYPFVMSYKDTINQFSFKEYREKNGIDFGDIGILKSLEACVEGGTNVLINRRTRLPFRSRKEIAEYLQGDYTNIRKSITKLIKAGLLYIPPGTKHFAMSEIITTCGKISEETYIRRHELSKGVEHKSKTENADHKQNTKREKEYLRRQRLLNGLPPLQEVGYPIDQKMGYSFSNNHEDIRKVNIMPMVEPEQDTEFSEEEIPF